MFALARERQGGDAILWGGCEGDVVREIALLVCCAARCRSGGRAEEGHGEVGVRRVVLGFNEGVEVRVGLRREGGCLVRAEVCRVWRWRRREVVSVARGC